jgi:arginine-tRNA-protein transferase
MNNPSESPLLGYATQPYPCNYLPGREAITLFVDPAAQKDRTLYSALAKQGFRRSGNHLYRPRCTSCQACIPVRVPVDKFIPTRTQKRAWKRNQDLRVYPVAPTCTEEHLDLYQRYLAARHPKGGMDNPSSESYTSFLTSHWADTRLYEFRLASRLLAVAVVDCMDDALSAVYTYFDPGCPERSLGRFAILYEIEQARQQGLQWLYTGYWIQECRKMHYKNEYQPLEYYVNGWWLGGD